MNKQQRMINTEYYEYTNVNPKNKFGGDCVIRAIANACNQSWEVTVREMTELGIKMGFVVNDDHVMIKYLLNKGFIQSKEPRDVCNRKMSVKDWMNEEQIYEGNHKTVIVAVVGSHHVTCIKNGKVQDIWNCSNRTMHRYWYKGAEPQKVEIKVKRRFTL